jgi:hypothetical protein
MDVQNIIGKPRVVASDRFCCSDFLSGMDWTPGIACEQACNIVARIVPDEHIEECLDMGNEDRNYWLAMRSGKFDITPSTSRESACLISLGASAV